MSRLLVSAAHKSSGKTTISIGICAAISARGMSIQPYKKGPDYIDPMWLSQACHRPCYNLDFYMMSNEEIQETFDKHNQDADLSLIEGNKGLYDGLDIEGSNSNAALAKLLQAPVVLVIDARCMTRGIAPLILGYQDFDRDINIAGVILNQLGGSRHESKLRTVIEHYTDVPVIGAVHHDPLLVVEERHLGLIPSNESEKSVTQIAKLATAVRNEVDLDRLLSIANDAEAVQSSHKTHHIAVAPTICDIRIAIAKDAAFGFYYPGDLETFEELGAELVPFNTLEDTHLPDNIDGLFIGGGFPEIKMGELAANTSLHRDIREKIEQGLPAYAECGGLMYLTRSIQWNEQCYESVGVIPADTVMHDRPQGRGYVILEETGKGPWTRYDPSGNPATLRAHEFHYSALSNVADNMTYAFNVKRGTGIDGIHDGIVYKNLLACYAHQRSLQKNDWVNRFLTFVRTIKHTTKVI